MVAWVARQGGKRQLVSERSLAAFHSERHREYLALAELLRSPRNFDRVAARVRAADESGITSEIPGGDELRVALSRGDADCAATEYEMLFSGSVPAVVLQCEANRTGVKAACCASSQLNCNCSGNPVEDIEILGALAARTAEALMSGDPEHAAALTELQIRFLRDHAGGCLFMLAQKLAVIDAPIYSRVGQSLLAMLEEDLRVYGLSSDDS